MTDTPMYPMNKAMSRELRCQRAGPRHPPPNDALEPTRTLPSANRLASIKASTALLAARQPTSNRPLALAAGSRSGVRVEAICLL